MLPTTRRLGDDGRFVDVLIDWCPSIPGLFLYYQGGHLVPAGLRVFIEVLREKLPAPREAGRPRL